MKMKFVMVACLSVSVCWLATEARAAPLVDGIVGVGVDMTTNQPWVAGSWDTDSDGIANRWQMTRYNTNGTENLGFNPDPAGQFLYLVGGGGVDRSGGGYNGHPWMLGARDTDSDNVPNDFTARRYTPSTGSDNFGFGFGLSSPNSPDYSEMGRAGGMDTRYTANDLWTVGTRQANGLHQINRFNARTTGADEFGAALIDGGVNAFASVPDSIGVGNVGGNPVVGNESVMFVTGELASNGVQSIRTYSITTGAEISGWQLDASQRFLDARGVGMDLAISQPWIVGAWDSDLNGIRDGWTARRYSPATGSDTLGFGLSSTLGDILDVEGIGVGSDRRPWFAVLLDIDSDGNADQWGLQAYSITTGLPEVDVLLDSRFTIPEPSSLLLLLGLGGMAMLRRRRV